MSQKPGEKETQLRVLRERKFKQTTAPKMKVKAVGKVVNIKAKRQSPRPLSPEQILHAIEPYGTVTLLTVEVVTVLVMSHGGRATLTRIYTNMGNAEPTVRCHLQRHCKYASQSWVKKKGWADLFRRYGDGVWGLRQEVYDKLGEKI